MTVVEDSSSKKFYDEFSKSKLLNDFRYVNPRQTAVKRLCDRYIPKNSRILEVGCGVGIISRHLQRNASEVLSIDITETGITIAEYYAKAPQHHFMVFDITQCTDDELTSLGKFDVVIFADVIEHIPKTMYSSLFANIEILLNEGGRILLTFPSSQYQEFIKENHTERLQVVDETVELDDILRATGLLPLHYSYRNIREENKYIHLVFQNGISFVPNDMSLIARFIHKIISIPWHLSNLRFLQGVKRVF